MSAGTSRKLRMLVVDDQPTVCDCIRVMLAHDGHEVQTVHSGEAALQVFKKDSFDLVITDYSMPGMKGDELAQTMKAFSPHQPIMMITANAPTPDATDSIDFIIHKPIRMEELRQVITRLSDGRCFT